MKLTLKLFGISIIILGAVVALASWVLKSPLRLLLKIEDKILFGNGKYNIYIP